MIQALAVSRRIVVFALVMAVCALSGCGSVQTGDLQIKDVKGSELQAKITKGKTTKEDVIRLVGEPRSKDYQAGKEIWIYEYQEQTDKATNYIPFYSMLYHEKDLKEKTFKFVFNGKGYLTDYSISDATGDVKGGVAR